MLIKSKLYIKKTGKICKVCIGAKKGSVQTTSSFKSQSSKTFLTWVPDLSSVIYMTIYNKQFIGRGCYGLVFKADHTLGNQNADIVAKQMLSKSSDDAVKARLLYTTCHKNVVSFLCYYPAPCAIMLGMCILSSSVLVSRRTGVNFHGFICVGALCHLTCILHVNSCRLMHVK